MNLEQTTARGKKVRDNGGPQISSEAFPSARYFQIHFEHIEALIAELRAALQVVREEVADLRKDIASRNVVDGSLAEQPGLRLTNEGNDPRSRN